MHHGDNGVAHTTISSTHGALDSKLETPHDFFQDAGDASLSTQPLRDILLQLRRRDTPSSDVTDRVSSEIAVKEWELVAAVLDRIFLFCYLIASIVFSITILLGH